MNVGLVGVGALGTRIAACLVEDGHKVWARDPAPEAQERARALGCRVATDAIYLPNHTEVIVMALPTAEAVAETVAKILRSAGRGLVLIDLSGGEPLPTGETGVDYLVATVTGDGALQVAGGADARERAKPVLRCLVRAIAKNNSGV